MSERAKAFRDIAEALLDPANPGGSCCGCSNVMDDALAWLKETFPADLPYVRIESDGRYKQEAHIVKEDA